MEELDQSTTKTHTSFVLNETAKISFKRSIPSRESVKRIAYILNRISSDQAILHLGCTDSPYTEQMIERQALLHERLLEKAPRAVGFDISRVALQRLQDRFPDSEFIIGNAERLEEAFPHRRFDLVVAGEILEHLSNPGMFFESAAAILKEEGVLLITCPNAFGLRRLIHVFLGIENYHPDHTFYFSENTLSVLAERHGLYLDKSLYYGTDANGSFIKKILYGVIESLPSLLFGNHVLDGLVIELKKKK